MTDKNVEEMGIDLDVAEEFVTRLFNLEQEINLLKEDRKALKDEFKDKLNMKLMGKLVRLVKLKLQIEEEDTSEDTIEEIESLILEHVNKVV